SSDRRPVPFVVVARDRHLERAAASHGGARRCCGEGPLAAAAGGSAPEPQHSLARAQPPSIAARSARIAGARRAGDVVDLVLPAALPPVALVADRVNE